MGFKEGNLLEPSCGIGNFIGMLPESMANTKIYGVELDRISAGIAQQLYQKSSIAAQGFEEVNVQDSFFDGVVGNVPFGDFKVLDKRYDKYNFLIHDYFFAKSLDKLRPGGVMALVTSKGTMDKTNSSVRKYIAQRADLLGAIRFPNNTFKDNAGTEVVSDILFLQKRDRLIDIEPDWVQLRTNDDGFTMNAYFVQHPEMILGEMKMVSGRFGEEATCLPFENADLSELLSEAVANIHGEVRDYEVEDELEEEDRSIPANPEVRNFSYTVVEDNIYFRENSRMNPVEVSATAENRIKGLIAVRDCVRNLIELQTEGYPDEDIRAEQIRLNTLYDNYTKKYGLINSRANISAFSDDSSFALLSALEVLKQKFASQIMTSKSPVRSAEDIDETALSYAEIKMLATGNPYIKEKMDLDIQVQKLKLLKSNFLSEKYSLEYKIIKYYPQRITSLENRIAGLEKDVETAKQHPKPMDDRFVGMEVQGAFYSEKADAGKAIIDACKQMTSPEAIPLGKYRGFDLELYFDSGKRTYCVTVKGENSRSVDLGDDVHGNITRIDNGVERFVESLETAKSSLEDTKNQFETAQKEVAKPFVQEEELKLKLARLDELNILLNMDKKENEIVGGEPDEGEASDKRSTKSYER